MYEQRYWGMGELPLAARCQTGLCCENQIWICPGQKEDMCLEPNDSPERSSFTVELQGTDRNSSLAFARHKIARIHQRQLLSPTTHYTFVVSISRGSRYILNRSTGFVATIPAIAKAGVTKSTTAPPRESSRSTLFLGQFVVILWSICGHFVVN